MSEEDSSNSTIQTLKFVGGSIKSTLKTVVKWTVAVTPIITLLAVWIAAFLQVIGIDVVAWAGLDPRLEAYLRIAGVAITLVIVPALVVAMFLTRQDKITLHDVAPKSGDTAGFDLPTERWQTLTVMMCVGEDEDGEKIYEEVSKDELWKINVKDGVGYECKRYDEETNTAYVSDYAGLAPFEIRKHESSVEYIETKYAAILGAAIDELANRTNISREAAAVEMNEAIRSREDISLPSDAGMPQSPLQQAIDKHIDTDETPSYADENLSMSNPTTDEAGGMDGDGDYQQGGDEQ